MTVRLLPALTRARTEFEEAVPAKLAVEPEASATASSLSDAGAELLFPPVFCKFPMPGVGVPAANEELPALARLSVLPSPAAPIPGSYEIESLSMRPSPVLQQRRANVSPVFESENALSKRRPVKSGLSSRNFAGMSAL